MVSVLDLVMAQEVIMVTTTTTVGSEKHGKGD